MYNATSRESGEINPLLIPLILAALVAIGLGVFGGWAYVNYTDQRDNTQSKIDVAVAKGKQEQQTADNKDFLEREKEPARRFIGPEDLGRVEFDYAKTWSVYVDTSGSSYRAYFHPLIVHASDTKKPYALKMMIESRNYDDVVDSFQSRVKQGTLRSDVITANGFNGVKLTGKLSEDLPNITMTIFKVRDKTLTLTSESPEFFADFNNTILAKLTFNP